MQILRRVATVVAAATLIFQSPAAFAQAGPHIGSMFPGGASAGKTVDVQIKGGNLIGVHGFLIGGGPGVTAEIVGGANPVDESAKPVFQSKCTTCHEARSPDNRNMSPEQWADTVKRMITQRGADIQPADRDRIVGYLQGVAKAGQISARITVAPNVAPGLRELRLLTDHGVSSATSFEVGSVPEMNAPPFKTGKPDEAALVKLPIAVNGILAQSGERDWYRFAAKKGQRLTFNLKAERLNSESSSFFFPTLHLFDTGGKELAKNLGKYGVDPFVDYVIPADGDYLILVHDLLWHGNPASIYRLTMGEIPADGVLSPGWARPGANISARLVSAGDDASDATLATAAFPIQVPMGVDGMTTVATPIGVAPLLVRDLPDGGGPQTANTKSAPVALPALFRGGIAAPGQKDTFTVHAPRGGMILEMYAQQLGSPLHAEVVVRNIAGDIIAQRQAEGDADFTLPNAFPRAGDYSVEVSDADGKGGAGYLYCWEAAERGTDMRLTVTPDVANLNPGTSMTLIVKTSQRRNINGPILLSIKGLPPGVTANDAVLLPEMNEAAIVLTASPGAAGGIGNFVTIEGRAMPPVNQDPKAVASPSAPVVTRQASPVELYSVNNNQVLIPRTTLVVAVQAVPPTFALQAAGGQSQITIADGKDIQIPVTVQRLGGFKGPLFVSVQGLPNGIYATQGNYNIPSDKTTVTVVLKVNHDARFFKEKPAPGQPPVRIVIAGFIANANADYIPALTSPPITLIPQ